MNFDFAQEIFDALKKGREKNQANLIICTSKLLLAQVKMLLDSSTIFECKTECEIRAQNCNIYQWKHLTKQCFLYNIGRYLVNIIHDRDAVIGVPNCNYYGTIWEYTTLVVLSTTTTTTLVTSAATTESTTFVLILSNMESRLFDKNAVLKYCNTFRGSLPNIN